MKIGHIVQKPIVQKLHKPTTQLIDSTTLLGIEIEVENYRVFDVNARSAGYWEVKEDGSLRNNGMEMVFYEPLYGADAIMAVTWLFGEAARLGWRISKLTGAHVHVDVRDMEVNEFKNLCAVYALTEPLIYKWVGDKRDENMFCLPWYMADAEVDKVSRSLTNDNPDVALSFIKSLSKYSGLNIGAAAKFGTVEFRMLQTTFDSARFIDWLNIILSLRVYAVKHGDKTPEWICKRLTSLGPKLFVRDVFGSLADKLWYDGYEKDAIGLGMVTCDWFLENTQTLQLKGTQSLAERFTLLRSKNLQISYADKEHAGLKKFQERNSTTKKAKRPAKSTVSIPQYGGTLAFEESSTVPEPAWIVDTVEPTPEEFDDFEEDEE